jgi:predicted transporter
MELKTLILGMFISMAAFSIKTGLGWAYLLSGCRMGQKITASALVLSVYAALFAVIALFVSRVNIIANYEIFRPLWQSGVALHWLAAVFIFVWGVILLKSNPSGDCGSCGKPSRAWLALVIPCPVCISVILVSSSCVALYFPDDSLLAMAGLYAAFAALASVSALAVRLRETAKSSKSGERENPESSEASLGTAMILIASYFMISAVVMPQFGEISRIYRLAVYSGQNRTSNPASAAMTFGAIILLFAIGFLYSKLLIKKSKKPEKTQKIFDYGSEPR